MPYTTTQIADQQKIVDGLKEDINWVKDVSYNFVGAGTREITWNGTRTAFWADWRTNNPNSTWSGLTYDSETNKMTGTLDTPYDDGGTTMIPNLNYNWWQWEMIGSEGYENGDWTSWISTKESTLATEESTLTTMKADPA
jgi:hypothetical protein